MHKLKLILTSTNSKINFFWAATFLVLVVFFWLTPLQVDDYTFYTTFSSIHNVKDFMHIDHYLFNNVNGRVMGNTLALILVSNRLLSSLFRAAVVIIVLVLSCRLLKIKTPTGRNLLVASLLFIPVPILAETYAWRAGFFNYVTPVALILLIISLLWSRQAMARHTLISRVVVYATLFLAGLSLSLFTENITVGTLAGSLLMVIWAALKERLLLFRALVLMVGSITGTWLMFSSPVYTRISSGSDAYRHVGHSANGTIQVILHNTGNIGRYLVVGNTFLYLILFATIIGGVVITKRDRRVNKWITGTLIVLISFLTFMFTVIPFTASDYKHLSLTQSLSYGVELMTMGLFFLGCGAFTALYIKDRDLRKKSFTLLIYTGLITAPLFLVQPISPRIFYAAYVLLVLYAATLLKNVTGRLGLRITINPRLLLLASYAVLVSGAIFYLSIFGAIRLREVRNAVSARHQISQGHTTVHIKRYPFSKFTYKDKYLPSWPGRYFSGSVCEYRQCDQQHIKVVFD